MNCVVTSHAQLRTRKRVGIPKKAVARASGRAMARGVRAEETWGGLRNYLDTLYWRGNGVANNMRVYGGFIYLFHDETLITVLNVPPKHMKQVSVLMRKTRCEL